MNPRGTNPEYTRPGEPVLTAALGQLISNVATALIGLPVVWATAVDMDVSAKLVVFGLVAVFLVPVFWSLS